jgi:hypothetical protein
MQRQEFFSFKISPALMLSSCDSDCCTGFGLVVGFVGHWIVLFINDYTVHMHALLFHNLLHHSWLLAVLSQTHFKVFGSDHRVILLTCGSAYTTLLSTDGKTPHPRVSQLFFMYVALRDWLLCVYVAVGHWCLTLFGHIGPGLMSLDVSQPLSSVELAQHCHHPLLHP